MFILLFMGKMISLHSLRLYTGKEIPFKGKFKIHQPRISELSEVFGEEKDFFKTINFLCLNGKDDTIPALIIFMSLFFSDFLSIEDKINVLRLLELVFKNHYIYLAEKEKLLLLKKDLEDKEPLIFTPEDFVELQEIFKDIFAYDKFFGSKEEEDYNPANKKAQEIMEKLKQRHATLARIKSKENEGKSILGNYLSIASIGLNSDLTTLSDNLTITQLLKEVERIGMRENFNQLLRIKTSFVTAGSSKEPLEDWMRLI